MIYLDQMMKSLEKVAELEGFADAMTIPVRLASDELIGRILQLQPTGYPEPYYGIPSSTRLGHTAIRDGWRPKVEAQDDKVRIEIGNISEHVKYVILGTVGRDIYPTANARSGQLFFWWGRGRGNYSRYGAGKNWGPKGKHEGKPGLRKFLWVYHPGTDPDPFVERAKDDMKEEMTDYIRAGVENYLREAMKP